VQPVEISSALQTSFEAVKKPQGFSSSHRS
jgi:hypothetical protein